MTKVIYNRNPDNSILTSKELAFFKKALKKQKVKILNNLDMTAESMDSFSKNNPKDEGDHASMALDQNLSNVILTKQAKNLIEIDEALERVTDDCYGVCDSCGEAINIERLKIKIFAKYCISCREDMEKSKLVS
jgi:DnaK suppressor protein